MPSERALEIMREIIGTNAMKTEQFNRGAEIIDCELDAAARHPYTRELCEILGWQGGTIHQALSEVKRRLTEKR